MSRDARSARIASPLQPGAARLVLRGEAFELLPERALWWPARGLLAVADLHLGKCATYRALGVAMPDGLVDETLARLHAIIERTGATRVVVVGDLVHASRGLTPAVIETFCRFLQSCPAAITLVRGNHDRDPLPSPVCDHVRDEGETLDEVPICFRHEPAPRSGRYVVAGHLHPTIALADACDRVRVPCFHFGPRVGVLPAFSVFTRGVPMACDEGDSVFAVVEDEVIEIACAHGDA